MQFFITQRWRMPKLVIAFFVIELAFTIPALILYAIADPDLYRTKLWVDGAMNGFNSNPRDAQYAAYNGRPVQVPLVWSSFITSYNVVISVLITFLMLVKAVMFTLHIWIPLLSFLVHATCTVLFAYSAAVQGSSDLSDPAHPQHGPPWYITKSCSVAHFKSNVEYCQQAKAAFAITIILTVIFAVNTIWAAYCCWPTAEEREERREQQQERDELNALEKWDPKEFQDAVDQWEPEQYQREMYEMDQFSKGHLKEAEVPLSPTTPRTRAFRSLGG